MDFIGIDDRLKEATRKYTSGGGRGKLTEALEEAALDYFIRQLQITASNMPDPAAAVQSAVGLVLRRNRIKGEQFKFLRERLMKQAEATYARWPEVA